MEEIKHQALEREIAELTEELEKRGSVERGKEAIREAVGERIYRSPLPPGATEPVKPKGPPATTSPLPNYGKGLTPEIKLKAERLLDLAWHKGISAAIREVRKTDPLTMDLFHDAITEKLYAEFKKRGILK